MWLKSICSRVSPACSIEALRNSAGGNGNDNFPSADGRQDEFVRLLRGDRSDRVRHQTSPSQSAQVLGDGRLVSDTIRPHAHATIPIQIRPGNPSTREGHIANLRGL